MINDTLLLNNLNEFYNSPNNGKKLLSILNNEINVFIAFNRLVYYKLFKKFNIYYNIYTKDKNEYTLNDNNKLNI